MKNTRKEYWKEYYLKNKVRIDKKNKEYGLANKKAIAKRQKSYVCQELRTKQQMDYATLSIEQKQRKLNKMAEYRLNTKPLANQRTKNWRKKNKEFVNIYRFFQRHLDINIQKTLFQEKRGDLKNLRRNMENGIQRTKEYNRIKT